MATGAAIRQVRCLFDEGAMGGLADARLIERFLTRDGEAAEMAFAVLVERHGPLVMRVCRRILGNPDDVLDAFQSTFLVLATKARSVRRRDSLGSWLYGVAVRVSRCARSTRVRRETHEKRRAEQSPTHYEVEPEGPGAILREELGRLPVHYHVPLVLCDLEELTHEQAASQLGWPVGTVKSRLSRGRAQLRERLIRRGLGCGALVATSPPVLPTSFIDALARTATKVATRKTFAGMVPASVEALLQGVRRMMIHELLRNGVIAGFAFGIFATSIALAQQPPLDLQVRPAELTPKPAAPRFNRLVINEVHVLEMKGTDWKDAVPSRLNLVKSGPGFKVWTGEAGILPELRKRMKHQTQAPRITAEENALATVINTQTVKYVASGNWVFSKDGGAAFHPNIGELQDGIVVDVAGHKIDQGMLVRVRIDSKKLLGFETFTIPAQVKEYRINAQIQSPALNQQQQEGEWLIPNGGVLVLSVGQWHEDSTPKKTNIPLINEVLDSFGVYAWVADHNYWSSPLIERLVVIDSKSFNEPIQSPAAPLAPILANPLPGFITTQGPLRP